MSNEKDEREGPPPRYWAEISSEISSYLDFDEEGLVPEEYVSLVPEAMIPVALEAEVQYPLEAEEGEEASWLHVEQEDDGETQDEPMQKYCDGIHEEDEEEEGEEEEEEEEEEEDEATEDFETFTGIVNEHNYECSRRGTKKATVKEERENENENQEVEDDTNPNSFENKA